MRFDIPSIMLGMSGGIFIGMFIMSGIRRYWQNRATAADYLLSAARQKEVYLGQENEQMQRQLKAHRRANQEAVDLLLNARQIK